ncbi:MAG: hypothetical protein RIQ56_882 [Candidatus Parcubacteria bacterium]|jgi:large subunit ribosomal protein L15
MANLNVLKRMTKRAYRRIGRGQSSTRGKTSGRGGKGQTARAGNKRRPEWRDIIKKLPKRRGYGKNRGRTVNPDRPRPVAVPLAWLDMFENGMEVTPAVLVAQKIIPARAGRVPHVKLIGAEISKKLVFKNVTATAGAKAAVEKAGGSVTA